jgi:hypothetical protein
MDAEIPSDLPTDFIERLPPGTTWRAASPMQPATFDEPIMLSSSLPTEQLGSTWSAIRGRESDHRPSRRRLIGLAGPAGSGKTLAASFIPDAVVVGLADPLYAAIAVMFSVPEVVLRTRSAKESPLEQALYSSPRRLLQTLGTEWGREQLGDTVWIEQARRRIQAIVEAGAPVVVIPDVRFANEAEWIRQGPHGLDGEVWHIRRPGADPSEHPSEQGVEIDPKDAVIENDGTAANLHEQVMRALLRPRS